MAGDQLAGSLNAPGPGLASHVRSTAHAGDDRAMARPMRARCSAHDKGFSGTHARPQPHLTALIAAFCRASGRATLTGFETRTRPVSRPICSRHTSQRCIDDLGWRVFCRHVSFQSRHTMVPPLAAVAAGISGLMPKSTSPPRVRKRTSAVPRPLAQIRRWHGVQITSDCQKYLLRVAPQANSGREVAIESVAPVHLVPGLSALAVGRRRRQVAGVQLGHPY